MLEIFFKFCLNIPIFFLLVFLLVSTVTLTFDHQSQFILINKPDNNNCPESLSILACN